jgi:hypothetical protein
MDLGKFQSVEKFLFVNKMVILKVRKMNEILNEKVQIRREIVQ